MAEQNNNRKKVKRVRFYAEFYILIVLVLFVGMFALYVSTSDLQEVIDAQTTTTTETTTVATESETTIAQSTAESVESETSATESSETTSPQGNPVPTSESVGMEYFDTTLFIGDSVTLGLASYQKIPSSSVFASIGMNLLYIEESKIPSDQTYYYYKDKNVYETISEKAPENIYIMLGSNGISQMDNDYLLGKYETFLTNLKTYLADNSINSTVYVISVPPVTAERENFAPSNVPIQNNDIDAFNAELLDIANEKNIYYVDFNSYLRNENGKLDSDKAASDGLHFNSATYDEMVEFIMTHVVQ